MSVCNGLVCVCTLMALQGGILATASCSYWYSWVPRLNLTCDPLGVDTSLACKVYVPHDLPTTVKWYRSELPQNDTRITAISDITHKYELNTKNIPDPNKTFSGLFYHLHSLKIINFTASDTGYYWCQIETNSTEDSLALQPSQYGYLAPNPGQEECSKGLLYFEDLNYPVCAVQVMSKTSFSTAILTSTVTSVVASSSIFSTITSSITIPSASSNMSPSSMLTPSANILSMNLPHASSSDDTVLSPSLVSSKLYGLSLSVTSELNSTHIHNSKVASVTPRPRSTPTMKPVDMFAIIGVMGGVILLLICVVAVIFSCIVICQCKKRKRKLWKERGRAANIYMYRPSLAGENEYSMECHSKQQGGPIYARPVVKKASEMLERHMNRAQSPTHSSSGASDDEYAMPQDAVLLDAVSSTKRCTNLTLHDDPLQEANSGAASKIPETCDPEYSVPAVDQGHKHAGSPQEEGSNTRAVHVPSEASPGSSVHEYAVLEPNTEQATPHHCHVGNTQELYGHPDAQEVAFDDPIYSIERVN